MDGSAIPQGRKMTFSLGCFLSGKQALEGAAVPLALADPVSPSTRTETTSTVTPLSVQDLCTG